MFSLILVFLMVDPAHAQSKIQKRSTNIYEAETTEEKSESFTAKVRVVRDISDEVEVFFESDTARGAYTLPRKIKSYATVLKTLQESEKPGGPQVSVKADSEKRIESVDKAARSGYQKKSQWDPGEIPDL
ncbi:hypothetical protein B9G69_002760 [Bdellovibrio sp. SKB1291214]|uniref:hypothetical protein n=1 Tax=Bdellovibrio sp. SKB1291214 TaxID=1732569 RepID=UPI000B514FA4|nr:hypothetical protein [Bdellovibrio sp. SKB1291214]UYL09493.1 hypothetical protein B9G69_002760 [Bdellovibrio sp. SKB1291214]